MSKNTVKKAASRKTPKWDGAPTTVKIEDWLAFKEANHLRVVRFSWTEGGQPTMVVEAEGESATSNTSNNASQHGGKPC